MFYGVRFAASAAFVVCAAASSQAMGLPTGVSLIADTQTDAPGVLSGKFSGFSIAPSARGGAVHFVGRWGVSGSGVVKYDGVELSSLVTNVTSVPGNQAAFDQFTSLSASADGVAFGGFFDNIEGAFLIRPTQLLTLVQTRVTNQINNPFEDIGPPSISGDQVVLWGTTPDSSVSGPSIFAGQTSINEQNRLVTLNQSPPGSSLAFIEFGSSPAASGAGALFWGRSPDRQGLFTASNQSINSLVDNTTPITGDTSPVVNIRQNFSFDGVTAAFIGEGTFGIPGVYLATQGAATRVASLFDAIPGGFGTFSDFQDVAVSGDRVVFTAVGSRDQQGLFTIFDDEIISLVDLSTNLVDGKSIAEIRIGREAIENDVVAFVAAFTDGTSGVFTLDIAAIPAPGGLLALPTAGLLAMRRRRS